MAPVWVPECVLTHQRQNPSMQVSQYALLDVMLCVLSKLATNNESSTRQRRVIFLGTGSARSGDSDDPDSSNCLLTEIATSTYSVLSLSDCLSCDGSMSESIAGSVSSNALEADSAFQLGNRLPNSVSRSACFLLRLSLFLLMFLSC